MNSANFLSIIVDLRFKKLLISLTKEIITFYQKNSKLKIKNWEKICDTWTMDIYYKFELKLKIKLSKFKS